MSVSILILSHDGIGSSLLGTAIQMIPDCPLEFKLLTIEHDNDPDEAFEHASHLVEEMGSGDGVLILTDLFGSTPCNIAKTCSALPNTSVVAGINLSMIIRIMNYPDLGLSELAGKAISGGQDGIMQVCETDTNAL